MKIDILKSSVSDNYFYLLSSGGRGLLIDPIDAAVANAAVRDSGVELKYVFNTHFHPDHVAGDDAVLAANGKAELVVPSQEVDLVAHTVKSKIDRAVSGGDVIALGGEELLVLDTPGHTLGHVSLRFENHLFSGDTIFLSGAGHCRFGGEEGVFFRTYRDVISALDDDVLYYPGHDYSVRNLEFALSLEPDLESAQTALLSARASSEIQIKSIGNEREYSPFFRYGSAELLEALQTRFATDFDAECANSETEQEAVFRCVRRLRNSW